MEKLIANMMAVGYTKEAIDRARKRGAAYQCQRCYNKDGVKVVNIKCRMEEHIVKYHMPKEEAPCRCLLCGFTCLKYDHLLNHLNVNVRHAQMVAKYRVTDNRPYLWKNPIQYKFGADDYLIYNQEASLMYFLGAFDKESATYNSDPVPTGVAAIDTSLAEAVQDAVPLQPALELNSQEDLSLASIAQPVIPSIWPALSFTQDEMPLRTVQSQVPEASVSTSNAGPVQPTILDQLNSIMRSIAQQQQQMIAPTTLNTILTGPQAQLNTQVSIAQGQGEKEGHAQVTQEVPAPLPSGTEGNSAVGEEETNRVDKDDELESVVQPIEGKELVTDAAEGAKIPRVEEVDGPGSNTLPSKAEEEVKDAVEVAESLRIDEVDGLQPNTQPSESEERTDAVEGAGTSSKDAAEEQETIMVEGMGTSKKDDAKEEVMDAVGEAGVREDEAGGTGTAKHPMEAEDIETEAQEGSVIAEQGSPRPNDISEDELSGDDDIVNQAEGEEKETALAGASKRDQVLSDAVLLGASLKRKRVEKEKRGSEEMATEDVLVLQDEDMIISSPKKRELEDGTKGMGRKRMREDLPDNIRELSEQTLVETVEGQRRVGARSVVVTEQLIRTVIDNSCLLAKLSDMVGRLDKRIEEHEKNEQKREERQERLEQRQNEEWRNAFFRLRQEERLWNARRKKWKGRIGKIERQGRRKRSSREGKKGRRRSQGGSGRRGRIGSSGRRGRIGSRGRRGRKGRRRKSGSQQSERRRSIGPTQRTRRIAEGSRPYSEGFIQRTGWRI